METEGLKQEAEGSTIEPTEKTTDITMKCECENKTEPNLDIFPTFPVPADELEAVIKKENCNEGVNANVAYSELIEAAANANNFNPNDPQTVTFETIPKTETSIVVDDDTPSNDTCSDGDSNSEPEIDPFADVECDPSFSQTPDQNHTSIGSATKVQLLNPKGGVNENSGPSSSAHTSNYKRQRKRRGNKLQCQLCLETQNSEISLKTHVEICAASHKHRCRFCRICNTLFAFPQVYRVHAFRIHGIDKVEAVRYPLKCEICPKSFSRKESLNAHIILCHQTHSTSQEGGLKPKPFRCLECPSSFATLSELSKHGQAHKSERPFKCPEPNCGKAFKYNGNLKEHLRGVHSDEKPLKCQELTCGKTFKTNDQLAKHMLCHTEIRPFQCHSYAGCFKTFKSKDRLTKHLKAHKGARRYAHIDITERPFKCSECDRAYCKNWQLTAHLKAHSTETFECPEPNCGVKCRYKQNLEIHISNAHTNKDAFPFYDCPETNCNKKYKHKQSLDSHLRSHRKTQS